MATANLLMYNGFATNAGLALSYQLKGQAFFLRARARSIRVPAGPHHQLGPTASLAAYELPFTTRAAVF